MENWKKIHKGFGKEVDIDAVTCQKIWEEEGLTYQDAKEWIAVGFEPKNYKEVKNWKNYCFSPQEANSWREIGFEPTEMKDYDEYYNYFNYAEFAAYLRGKGYQPSPDLNLKQLREEFDSWEKASKLAQEYLDAIFPKSRRKEIKELDISENVYNTSEKNFQGVLDLSDFVNLEELDCYGNKLTDLKLDNCLKLTSLDIRNNNFLKRDLSMFSKLVNLENLMIGNVANRWYFYRDKITKTEQIKQRINRDIYNCFVGSLKPLESLSKLWSLDISNTDLSGGVECLPDSLRNVFYSTKERPESRVKEIAWQLEKMKKDEKATNEKGSSTDHFSWKWKDLKKSLEKASSSMEEKFNRKMDRIINNSGFVKKVTEEINISCFDNLISVGNEGGTYSKFDKNNQKEIKEFLKLISFKDYPSLKHLMIDLRGLEGLLPSLDSSQNKKLQILIINHSKKFLNESKLKFLESLTSLEELDLSDNSLSGDLEPLKSLINLKRLDLSGNKISGSLEPLKNMNKLEKLVISNTDIDRGLEYLPDLKEIYSSYVERPEARVSDIYEELLPFVNHEKGDASGLKGWKESRMDKKLSLQVSPLIPPQLLGEIKQKSKLAGIAKRALKQEREKQFLEKIQDFKYEMFSNQWEKSNFSVPKSLPIRLYDIKSEQNLSISNVEELKKNVKETSQWEEKKKYVALSYLWGECKDGINWDENGKFANLTPKGRIALTKAIKACELLGIDCLWIDQLCINQDESREGRKERGQEVPKMRQYYGDADVTLIAIDEKVGDLSDIDLMDILRKIVNSEWFTRSWTFQEGWLSKHTIFMFDDKLVDGWEIAGTWALNQLGYANEGRYNSRSEFDRGTKKIATPVGWTYHRDGYSEEDKVEMTLNQALKEIKNRGRSNPADGIYSILGLLPYGKQVEVKYKPRICPECPNQAEIEEGCQHEEKNKKWATYTKEDLEEILYNTTKTAVENRYIEPLAWYGEENGLIPRIFENGSTNIKGGIRIVYDDIEDYPSLDWEEKKRIRLKSTNYLIQKVISSANKWERGFEVEGGLYRMKVKVKSEKKPFCRVDEEPEEFEKRKKSWEENELLTTITLLGTKKSLKIIEELVKEKPLLEIILARPNIENFKSTKAFALLLTKKDGDKDERERDIYCRLGLVELGNGVEQLEKIGDERIIISDEKKVLEQVQEQAQIIQSTNLPYGVPSSSGGTK